MIERIIKLCVEGITGYQQFAAAILDFLTTTISLDVVGINLTYFQILFGVGITWYLGFVIGKFLLPA